MELLETAINENNKPKAKYPPSLPVTIEKIWLRIEPDFSNKTVIAEEQIKILAKQKINSVELDVGDLVQIKSVSFSTGADSRSTSDKKELQMNIQNGKVGIDLEQTINEGERFYLIFHYTAKDSEIGQGIHFENDSPTLPSHLWTLSESIYARNWFICIDHPQVKFTKEISVVVPPDYLVLSNGELNIIDQDIQVADGTKKRKFVWQQTTPDSAYLSCMVIGKFVETSDGENYNGIPLRYYVPPGREADAKRTFNQTANMLKIFEEYLHIKYPYNKYSQVVVKGLTLAGADGMEHTSCTLLDIDDVLAESGTPADRIRHDVIAHELAHQWFGDLVTCKDWQDIWLNEGFAAYFEALYFEKNIGEKEYLMYIAQMTQRYIRSTHDPRPKTPIRAIVTNKYDHPDDMFDHNTYYKGGIVLHMLRKKIGDENFQKSLHRYLELYQYNPAETDDLRQILEKESGINLQQFFEQWVYREGHPKLGIKISDDDGKVRIEIVQSQGGESFIFPLDLHFVLSKSSEVTDDMVNTKIEQIQISDRTFSKTFDISIDEFDHLIIDPEFKVLKEYQQLADDPDNFLVHNLSNGVVVYSKVKDSTQLGLASPHVKMAINVMDKVLRNDQKSRSFVKIPDLTRLIENASSDKKAHEQLVRMLAESNDSKARRTILDALGHFKNMDSFDILKSIVENKDADPYERYFAAIAIGNIENKESFQFLKEISNINSYHNLVARGSVEGLKIFAINSTDDQVREEVEELLIEKTKTVKESRLKRTATSSLGYMARYGKNRSNIVNRLIELLHDESLYVRNSACAAIANALEGTNDDHAKKVLKKVSDEDVNPIVRATAKACIDIVKDHLQTTGKVGLLEKETAINSKYQSEKFELLDEIEILS